MPGKSVFQKGVVEKLMGAVGIETFEPMWDFLCNASDFLIFSVLFTYIVRMNSQNQKQVEQKQVATILDAMICFEMKYLPALGLSQDRKIEILETLFFISQDNFQQKGALDSFDFLRRCAENGSDKKMQIIAKNAARYIGSGDIESVDELVDRLELYDQDAALSLRYQRLCIKWWKSIKNFGGKQQKKYESDFQFLVYYKDKLQTNLQKKIEASVCQFHPRAVLREKKKIRRLLRDRVLNNYVLSNDFTFFYYKNGLSLDRMKRNIDKLKQEVDKTAQDVDKMEKNLETVRWNIDMEIWSFFGRKKDDFASSVMDLVLPFHALLQQHFNDIVTSLFWTTNFQKINSAKPLKKRVGSILPNDIQDLIKCYLTYPLDYELIIENYSITFRSKSEAHGLFAMGDTLQIEDDDLQPCFHNNFL